MELKVKFNFWLIALELIANVSKILYDLEDMVDSFLGLIIWVG
jgi:hypothetical protein